MATTGVHEELGNVSGEPRRIRPVSDSDHRLTVLGRIAQRIAEHTSPQDLCAFVYSQLRDELPVDSFYIAQAELQAEGLRGVLVIDEDIEYPPSSLYIEAHDDSIGHGPRLFDREKNLHRWTFGTERPALSALTCSMRAGGRLVGQIAVMAYSANAYTAQDAQFLQTVADQLATTFERQLTAQAVEQREAELQTLLESNRVVSTSLDVDTLLAGLARSLVEATEADAAIVVRWESEHRRGVPVAHYTAPSVTLEGELEPFTITPHSTAEAVLIEQQTITADPDAHARPDRELRWSATLGWRAQIALPLTVNARAVGMVELGSRDEHYRFTPRNAVICRAIIEQATVGIHHAQVYQRAVGRGAFLSGLAGMAEAINNAPDDLPSVLHLICDEAIALLGMSHASVFLLDPSEQRLELRARSGMPGPLEVGARLAAGDPYSHAARAVRERRMIVDVDLSRKSARATSGVLQPVDVGSARSAIAAPLRHHGVTLGALLLTDRRKRQTFHTEELRLATGLAGQAAAALARSQIRAVEQERLQIASVLGTISASIGADADAQTIYGLILHQAATLIPYEEASITLSENGTIVTGAAVGPTLQTFPGGTATARLWRDHQNLDLAACMRDPALAQILEAAGLQDVLSVPLLVNGAVMGRLTFAGRRAGQYETHQAQLAAMLAERTSQVVRTVQLRVAQEAALAKLTQLDALRQDFVATVSHELRTPLTGILGYIELLLNRWSTLDETRRRSMIERVQSSATRLEHLVTDLLLFSNVEHQELQMQITRYPVAALVEQAVSDISTKYRGQVVNVRPAERKALVQADAQRAIQVMTNLLDNAVKYSDVGSPIHVRWTVHREEVEVRIRDHGPGIEEADMHRLFTRFGTLGHQPRPGQVGTGIGLYICKKLLDAMSGRIWVTSRPGYGSTFHFTLPRTAE